MLFCTVVLLLLILIASGCESSNPNGFEVSMPDKTVEYNPLMKNGNLPHISEEHYQ